MGGSVVVVGASVVVEGAGADVERPEDDYAKQKRLNLIQI